MDAPKGLHRGRRDAACEGDETMSPIVNRIRQREAKAEAHRAAAAKQDEKDKEIDRLTTVVATLAIGVAIAAAQERTNKRKWWRL
jgi:hypothetical protein